VTKKIKRGKKNEGSKTECPAKKGGVKTAKNEPKELGLRVFGDTKKGARTRRKDERRLFGGRKIGGGVDVEYRRKKSGKKQLVTLGLVTSRGNSYLCLSCKRGGKKG